MSNNVPKWAKQNDGEYLLETGFISRQGYLKLYKNSSPHFCENPNTSMFSLQMISAIDDKYNRFIFQDCFCMELSDLNKVLPMFGVPDFVI